MEERSKYYDPLSLLLGMYDWLLLFFAVPSFSVLLFLRYRFGYRFMNPIAIGLAVLAFSGLSGIGGIFGGGGAFGGSVQAGIIERYGFQFLFCAGMIGLAIYHRRAGWKLIFEWPGGWHTNSRGLSHLSRVLPMRVDIVQRWIEPLVCMAFGVLLMFTHLTYLGCWIAFSGGSLAVMEQLLYEKALNRALDRYDLPIEAKEIKAEDEIIKHGGRIESRPLQQSGGIRMTVSPQVSALLMASAGATA